MGNANKNSMIRYLFIVFLCMAMLMANAGGLHMHVQHDDHSLAVPEHNHTVDIHISHLHHVDVVPDGHHYVAIDISQDSLVKKMSQLDPLVLIVLVFSFFLFPPILARVIRQWRYRPPDINTCHYLLCPHLRAPPVS